MAVATDGPVRADRKTQQRLERGEAAALGELYDRYASLVHGLANRVLEDERAADAVTREVFGHVWENPSGYDHRKGPLRTWLAELTRTIAVRRLHAAGTAELRRRGADPEDPEALEAVEELEARVREAAVAARADYIVTSMPAPLRAALDLAHHHRRDYRRVAADLGVTEEEARRRIR
ncbi:sigma-70 family RNA polymerase sigma factor, partial [Streptomyces sp. UH6]|uniref:sigma-70 family RNA polymerase sigma factor n=1 Tax=Streptomyces sp. UH6 TaxID=2748379 RepID=UPI0015D4EC5D